MEIAITMKTAITKVSAKRAMIKKAQENTDLKQRLMKQHGITEGTTNGKRIFYAPGNTPRSSIDRIAKL